MDLKNPLLAVFPDNDSLGAEIRMLELYNPLDHETEFFRFAPLKNSDRSFDLVLEKRRHFGKIEGSADPLLFHTTYTSFFGSGIGVLVHTGDSAVKSIVLIRNIQLEDYAQLSDKALDLAKMEIIHRNRKYEQKDECRQYSLGVWQGYWRKSFTNLNNFILEEVIAYPELGNWHDQFDFEKLAKDMQQLETPKIPMIASVNTSSAPRPEIKLH